MRRAAKIDDNQRAIVAALRACGALVCSLAGVGKGAPDLLVAKGRRVLLLEVKNKAGRGLKLTKAQADWQALGWPITIVTTVDTAIEALKA